jgi:4a-hydroxytetrahydrobiopterin dehydratase
MSQDSIAREFTDDPELGDWRVSDGKLWARFATGENGFSTGAELASRIAAKADELDHHPDVDLRYSHVVVSTVSHDVGRLTRRDRRLAVAISQIAAQMGLRATPEELGPGR